MQLPTVAPKKAPFSPPQIQLFVSVRIVVVVAVLLLLLLLLIIIIIIIIIEKIIAHRKLYYESRALYTRVTFST